MSEEAVMGGSWLAYVFFLCVAVITVGLLWFRVFRPMLEDLGVIQPVQHSFGALGSVNPSQKPPPATTPGYVARPAPLQHVGPMSVGDTDTDTDTDTPPDITPGVTVPGATIYKMNEEQIARIRADEQLAGVARTLGVLKGLGLLAEVERAQRLTEVKTALIGTSRERHKRLNRLIEAEAAKVSQPAERDLLAVSDEGGPRLLER
jgi:uncharacterized iron-regulated membrane protein